jgi:signal transduction histidine kinase
VSSTTLRGRLVKAFLGLALVTLIGVAAGVAVSVRLYDAQDRVVDKLFRAFSATADLNRALLDQETGVRGFVLTGDEEFLEPYQQGQRAQEAAQARLARAERDFPSLRSHRREVEEAAAVWRRTSAVPDIEATRTGAEPDEARLRQSKARFDEVREQLVDYRAEVLRLRVDSVDELRQDLVLLLGVLALALALLIASAVGAWLALRSWVTRPLEQLGHEVERVEGGDLAWQVVMTDVPDEIRVLAEQVDRMRVRILHEFALAQESRTQALEAHAVVAEQAEDLRRSNAELEQFAYVASHDLQEPLRKVASFCQLIERRYKGQLDERGEQYIEFAVDGAKRMQQLINDLLAFSRVGRTSTAFTTVELEPVFAQAIRQLETSLEESSAEVTHDPLPRVQGEASLLVQLLQNLIGNGVKFRGDEPPRIHIGVRRSDESGFWEFSCSDNGIGIAPQYEDKIFVIFQRLHARDSYGGTGIGLAMCKKIVEHHGGRLWLDADHEGGGATFRWTMPVDVSELDSAPIPTNSQPTAVRKENA